MPHEALTSIICDGITLAYDTYFYVSETKQIYLATPASVLLLKNNL